ncbi:hypothetical protein SAMN05421736_12439 [Evansella caseinilytica]|uniref:Uncharacterized protein n=1 Tax=Evansella caseinilytica TaxID=1503961 RepID=A0A1H3UPH6_9BACI|nr:hypothetical protein [Evansella caseinilytica]SDZ64352.1 hypothetical protein SAMN05421736_12439 [Evansella caseinilytica]
MKVQKKEEFHIKEALKGLIWGLIMMIGLFLVLHFVFGIKAFQ